jgi:purine-cytosine permease-like protein
MVRACYSHLQHAYDGRANRIVGWGSLAAGVLVGLALGLWSFDGPLPVPSWLGEYTATPRRLFRLGHIAFFGLGMLNVLLGGEILEKRLTGSGMRTAGVAMNFGNICLPVTLFGAALYHPIKYLMSIPALSVLIAFAIAAYSAYRTKGESHA